MACGTATTDYTKLAPTRLFSMVFQTIMSLFAMPMEFLEIIGLFFVGTKLRETITTGRMSLSMDFLPAQLMAAAGQVIVFAALAPAYQVILDQAKSVSASGDG